MRALRVVHVISGLSLHGAQLALHRMLAASDRSAIQPTVITLGEGGAAVPRFRELGVPVLGLHMRRAAHVPRTVARLSRWLRRCEPDVVQTWMYHADVVGGLAARLAGIRSVAWNLRQTDLLPAGTKAHTLRTVQVAARLSASVPQRIVCCSEEARATHEQLGYHGERMLVIENGFHVLDEDEPERTRARRELGFSDDDVVIGRIGRFHPQKDYKTLAAAAGRVAARAPAVRFLLCGTDIDHRNGELVGWLRDAGIDGRTSLIGEVRDVSRINRAMDIACSSSSYGEGFPNVIGEAMAAGVPVVATDVGASARIVGSTGTVVPAGDPDALATALLRLAQSPADERRSAGRRARARIVREFSVARMADRYATLYRSMAAAAADG